MTKYFTGIGSRKTPKYILKLMKQIARELANQGYVLRSGGAEGADNAFEEVYKELDAPMEIYLPWDGYNGRKEDGSQYILAKDLMNYESAIKITAKHHPFFYLLTPSVKKLIVRDTYQVLGRDLDEKEKSRYVICWTPDECSNSDDRTHKTGGTGQAISVADHYGVFIRNLARKDHYESLIDFGKD